MRQRTVNALLVVGIALACPPIWATTFVLATPQTLTRASQMVILGRVVSLQSVQDGSAIRTNVGLSVEETLKGAPVSTVTVVEPGGSVAQRRQWIFGTPTFFVGERVLLFLQRGDENQWHTTFLGMGKFSVLRDADGNENAVRELNGARVYDPSSGRLLPATAPSAYPLGQLRQQVRMMSEGSGAAAAVAPGRAATGSQWQAHFAFSGPTPVRWLLPDEGMAVTYRVSAEGDEILGQGASMAAVAAALAAWSAPACTNLRLVADGVAEPATFGVCDGKTQIVFNDPAGEINDPVDCAGVLAIGGVCADATTTLTFNGGSFSRITEGDVVVNNGFAGCSFWTPNNIAEILTHEVGHTIGLAHSSDDPNEPDPVLRNATMYYQAHFDGRGASLTADDEAALCALYPSGQTGSLQLRQFALIFNPNHTPNRDRLVLDGTLSLAGRPFYPQSETLILDIRVASDSLLRLAVPPATWQGNSDGSRFRSVGKTGTGNYSLVLTRMSDGDLRLTLRAAGLDLSPAQSDPVSMSLAVGDASVSSTIGALRNQPRARLFP